MPNPKQKKSRKTPSTTYTPARAFDAFVGELMRLRLQWRLFAELSMTSIARVTALNDVAPSVFGIAQDALKGSLHLLICRLIDPAETGKRENLTLRRLADDLGLASTDPQLQAIDTALAAIEVKAVSIRQARDKWFAHVDLPTILQIHKLSTITVKEAGEIIDQIIAAFDMIRAARGEGQTFDDYDTAHLKGEAQALEGALLAWASTRREGRRDAIPRRVSRDGEVIN